MTSKVQSISILYYPPLSSSEKYGIHAALHSVAYVANMSWNQTWISPVIVHVVSFLIQINHSSLSDRLSKRTAVMVRTRQE